MRYSEEIILKKEDKDIIAYTIINDFGFTVEILNLGGIITKIYCEDKFKNLENIVLSLKNKEDYLINPTYMGAIIGRTAGRIYGGKINISGIDYDLSKNYDPHSGHGGEVGFDKKIWDTKIIEEKNRIIIELKYKSEDGEENYPGKLESVVRYIINNDNELHIEYEAISDKDTLVNMTNHTYFNLSGNIKRPITENSLQVDSDYILEIDETQGTTGKKVSVDDTPFDFREERLISDYINCNNEHIRIGSGYNHPWILNKKSKNSIYLKDSKSGRTLRIETTEPIVVIYTMNFENPMILQNNEYGKIRYGICLETQKPPIGKDMCFIEDSLLKRNTRYIQKTIYRFGVEK